MAPSWRMASQIWGLKALLVRPRGSTHLQRPSLVLHQVMERLVCPRGSTHLQRPSLSLHIGWLEKSRHTAGHFT